MAGTPASRRAAGVQAEGGFAGTRLQGAERPKMGGSRSKRAEGGALSLAFRARRRRLRRWLFWESAHSEGGQPRTVDSIVDKRSTVVASIRRQATMTYALARRDTDRMILHRQYCNRHVLSGAAALGIVLVIPAAPAFAGARSSAVSQPTVLVSLFSGKTLVVSSRYGDIPMRFFHDGTIAGSAQALGPLAADDHGRWWVSQQRICVQWQTWMNGQPHCFAIEMAGGSFVRWRADSGEEGVARFEEPGARR